jgi:hypothetical protein
MKRTIVFGDVHGCSDELQDLLRAVGAGRDDRLVCVGDLIGKGPDSRSVLDWTLEQPNLEGVLGNHELRFIEAWRAGRAPQDKPYDPATLSQLGESFGRYMGRLSAWPMTLNDGASLFVHAGFDPRLPLDAQEAHFLANVRRLEGERPWYELYGEPRLVVFGHWARREPVVRSNAIGLDTGCVYGGRLTALILPERRLVSVPARRAYARKSAWS